MTLLNRLERNIGWIAIGHLPLYLVSAQGLVYIWAMMNPGQIHLLMLDPVAVLQGGEVWRLLTFLFVVPMRQPLFAFFYLYLLYIYGTALENEWGSFPFTLFYLIGALGTVASSLLFGNLAGAFYLNLTIFLAFSVLYPDFVLHLFFILPVKIKWLAWLTWAWILYSFVVGPFYVKAIIGVSLANYLLFFAKAHYDNVMEAIRRYQHRRRFRDWGE